MKRFATLLLAVSLLSVSVAQAEPARRRFALVMGANDGGVERAELRYAERDAERFGEVLEQLGGVASENLLMLRQPTPSQIRDAFHELDTKLQAQPNTQRELFVYYSGHADEHGLILGQDSLSYQELRSQIEALPADVRVGVVDACAAGALVRSKGSVRRLPFLEDTSSNVRGSAFVASASADEAAQESDRVGGSYFSHALLTGLRGAADMSGDGRVTLNEAYQFAYNETLAHTEGTRHGAQHANYEMELTGSGDVVMTSLEGQSAKLVMSDSLAGRVFLRDSSNALVAELRKPQGRVLELAMGPGIYQILIETENGALEKGSIELSENSSKTVEKSMLESVSPELAQARGDAKSEVSEKDWTPFGISFVPGFASDDEKNRKFSLNIIGGVNENIKNLEVGSIFNVTSQTLSGTQVSAIFNYAEQGEGVQVSSVNIANQFNGVQVGVVDVISKPFSGVQVGVTDVASELEGVQAGMFNIAGKSEGAQVGVLNIASELNGAQVGVLNIGSGVQVGVLNIAGKAHTQVGVLNIAAEVEGESVGLIPFVAKGHHHGILFSNEEFTAFGYQLGSDHFRATIFSAVDFYSEQRKIGAGLSFGAHLPVVSNFYLDIDFLGAFLGDKDFFDPNKRDEMDEMRMKQVNQFRLLANWEFLSHLSIFAGPTLTYITHPTLRRKNKSTSTSIVSRSKNREWSFDDSDEFKEFDASNLHPGLTAGIRF